jgi:hypothetical protein
VEGLFQVFSTLTDFDKSVQETFKDDDQREQAAPGFLGGFPAIGVVGLRLWLPFNRLR